jgi:hypothetical protein
MPKMNILVIGRHAEIQQTILRLLNGQPGWHAAGALTDEEAVKAFSAQLFDIVLIGGGVDESSEAKLVIGFKNQQPSIKIVRHFGGGSGLLFAEIMEAIKNKTSQEEV